jgi:hypothetical protein
MAMRIRVTTRADLYEKRKQEHLERGYRIEEERPVPVNGFCTFVAVRELPASNAFDEEIAHALNGSYGSGGGRSSSRSARSGSQGSSRGLTPCSARTAHEVAANPTRSGIH